MKKLGCPGTKRETPTEQRDESNKYRGVDTTQWYVNLSYDNIQSQIVYCICTDDMKKMVTYLYQGLRANHYGNTRWELNLKQSLIIFNAFMSLHYHWIQLD